MYIVGLFIHSSNIILIKCIRVLCILLAYSNIYYYFKGLTSQEINAQAFIFFFAAYDTTSTTMAFLLYCLATNQDCQERVYQEVKEVMKDCVRIN